MKKLLVSLLSLSILTSGIGSQAEAEQVKKVKWTDKKVAAKVKKHDLSVNGIYIGKNLLAADKLKNVKLVDTRTNGANKPVKKYVNGAYNPSVMAYSDFQDKVTVSKRKITRLAFFENIHYKRSEIRKIYGKPLYSYKGHLSQNGVPSIIEYYSFGAFFYPQVYNPKDTLSHVMLGNFKKSDIKHWYKFAEENNGYPQSITKKEWETKNYDMKYLR